MRPGPAAWAQSRGGVAFAAQNANDLRDWGRQLDSMTRTGELRTRQQRTDPLVAGRTHERADQYYRGVRVFGGDVARQYESSGLLVSAFGTLYDNIDVDPAPAIGAAQASRIASDRAGLGLPTTEPELVVLPQDDGRYTLTWRVRALTTGDLRQYFVDAANGSIAFEYSDLQTQAASIGKGTGVLGDAKKVSVTASITFTTTDRKRPPSIITYDMQGNFTRSLNIINGVANPTAGDIASDTDNVWTDGSVVDAHAYAGYVYDYFFRRFNRHGLDNADIPIRSLVNPARRSDAASLFNAFPFLFTNAGYLGGGLIYYGVGLPPGQTAAGKAWDFTSGALDIVGHELAHGVTDYSSGLIYRNESGALNEAFSDIMGTAIEFFYQPPGSARLQADYLCGEDVVTPNGIRSMSDPQSMGQPDHYSRRVITSADNGGVHINSGIANHAFYLAIEGGTNRTSGLGVQGVGGASREQIERVFYRAFTQLMPANATFATARAATIQASVDLFGGNSAANRAVTQAWTAVGVN
jgi:thermolysin